MAAATGGEAICGDGPASGTGDVGKRGHLGIPEAIFVVSKGSGERFGEAGRDAGESDGDVPTARFLPRMRAPFLSGAVRARAAGRWR